MPGGRTRAVSFLGDSGWRRGIRARRAAGRLVRLADLDGDGDCDLVFGRLEGTGGDRPYLNFTAVPTGGGTMGKFKRMYR